MRLKNYWLYFKTIVKHKWYVFLACKDCGIWWRGVKHDMSKFYPVEFKEYAENFSIGKSPVDTCKEKLRVIEAIKSIEEKIEVFIESLMMLV